MRIIAGSHGGRRINPPSKLPDTRPTTDLAKEGIFNTLQNMIDFEGTSTLELFSGTGSVSYELASRGATSLIVIEKDKNAAKFITKTVAEFGFPDFKVIQGDVFRFLTTLSRKFDFIFADPPYALPQMDDLPKMIFELNLLNEGGLFVLEHDWSRDYAKHPNFIKSKKYGTTIFSIFEL